MNYAFDEPNKPGGRKPQKTLSLGSYPALTLSVARDKRDQAKAMLVDGRDPAVERKITAKAHEIADGNTFEIVARRWHQLRKPNWSAVHADDVTMRDTDRERAEAQRRALADQERLKRSNEAIEEEIERIAAMAPYQRY